MMRGYFGGLGLVATDIFMPSEIAFFQKVWPTIRVAARFTDPNWAALGYPSGIPISAVTAQIITANWSRGGNIRRAANFSDINWSDPAITIPSNLLAQAEALTHPPAAAPVPEVVATPPTATAAPTPTVVQPTMRTPEQSPTAQPANSDATSPAAAPVPEAQQPTTPYVNAPSTPVYDSGYVLATPSPSPSPNVNAPIDWTSLLGPAVPAGMQFDANGNPVTPTTTQPAVKQAGMFGGSFPIVAAVALGAAVLFGVLPGPKHGRGRKRRRARA